MKRVLLKSTLILFLLGCAAARNVDAGDLRDFDAKSVAAIAPQMLSRYDLGGVQTWAYADEFEERVRFAVDRAWGGELPRTYLFDGAHKRQVRSGPADPAWLEPWLAQVTASK